MFRNHMLVAWRSILRHKGNTLINILGLSLGICACLIAFLIVRFEWTFDRFHPDAARIFRLTGGRGDQKIGFVIDPLPGALRDELTGLENVTFVHQYFADVLVPGEGKRFDAAIRGEESTLIAITDPQYFDIFPYRLLAGRISSDPFTVVLTESEARKYFGELSPDKFIGKSLLYKDVFGSDSALLSVSGIVGDWKGNSDLRYGDFISFSTIGHSFLKKQIPMGNWGNWDPSTQGFVKLAKGVTPARVEAAFRAFMKKHSHDNNAVLSLQPLSDIHFDSQVRDTVLRKANKPTLYALMGIAAFLLSIAAVNFIHLSTVQTLSRLKEIGVRKVMGSTRSAIRVQFLVETLITTAFAVCLSVVLTYPLLTVLHTLLPPGIQWNLGEPAVWIFLTGLTLLVTAAAGAYPAVLMASYKPVLSLKGETRIKGNSLRKALIVFQFTISLVFIICTLITRDQVHFILTKDLGFDKDAIVTVRSRYNDPPGQAGAFAERIRQLAGVRAVTAHMETPVAKSHGNTYIALADYPSNKIDASYEMSDAQYVPLFRLKLVAGRNIVSSDTAKEFLINETCLRALGFRKTGEALGKLVEDGRDDSKGVIVGVLQDFHSKSLREPISPFFLSSDRNSERAISILLAQGDFASTIDRIGDIWKEYYPDERFDVHFFDQTIARLYESEQRTLSLINIAMWTALFISCMGLFGLAAFTARQRAREIAVRKVLGAGVPGLIGLLCKGFLKLVFLAALIAAPIAWYFMHSWLSDFAYRVPIRGWVFLAATGGAALLAILTIAWQSLRAALTNPIHILRN